MQCPYQIEAESDDGDTDSGANGGSVRERCPFTGTLREVERHRHREHGDPKWDVAFDLPPGEPEAVL